MFVEALICIQIVIRRIGTLDHPWFNIYRKITYRYRGTFRIVLYSLRVNRKHPHRFHAFATASKRATLTRLENIEVPAAYCIAAESTAGSAVFNLLVGSFSWEVSWIVGNLNMVHTHVYISVYINI